LTGRGSRHRILVVALAMASATLALGTGAGHAAAGMSVSLSPLIGATVNEVQQVTYGGKIGFHLVASNSGDSTANHLVVAVESNRATFSDASQPACAADPNNPRRMVCSLTQMRTDAAPFSVDLRFDAPSSGATVVTTPSVTIDAQSQGQPANNGTNTFTGTPVTTALVSSAANSLVKTFAKKTETTATSAALPQHSSFTMPATLLGGPYGVEMSVQETTGPPLCKKCPGLVTDLQIPASLQPDSPFSPTNPYSFTITLLPEGEPPGYQPSGLYHDGVLVPMCSAQPLGTGTHMCLTSFVPAKSGVVAAGIADQNGKIGFG
jgi:hypothetical protein